MRTLMEADASSPVEAADFQDQAQAISDVEEWLKEVARILERQRLETIVVASGKAGSE